MRIIDHQQQRPPFSQTHHQPVQRRHRVATPANWRQGDDVIIAGSVPDEEARTIWPQGWQAPRPYIRIVPQP